MIFHDFLGNVQAETGAALPLLGRKIGIKDFPNLHRGDTASGIFNSDVNVKILLRAFDSDRSFFLRRSLNTVDDNVLNRSHDLDGIAKKRARVLTDLMAEFHAILLGNDQRCS